MAGRGGGAGRGTGWRIVELRRLDAGSWLVVAEHPRLGRLEAVVRSRDGVLETPFGSYHVSQLRTPPGGAPGRGAAAARQDQLSWLVEARGGVLRARLAVRVVELLRRPGEEVEEGEPLLVVETMKMLNEVPSPCHGVVEKAAKPGEGVQPGQVLAVVRCRG